MLVFEYLVLVLAGMLLLPALGALIVVAYLLLSFGVLTAVACIEWLTTPTPLPRCTCQDFLDDGTCQKHLRSRTA